MTASEQLPEDDTALLTTALNHYWAWYDGRANSAFQITNFYIVASAVLFTGYTSAINGKHYGVAAAIAFAGLGITALTGAVVLGEATAAILARPGLTELQNRMADRLRIDPIRTADFQLRRTRRRLAATVGFGAAALAQIGGLLYAFIH